MRLWREAGHCAVGCVLAESARSVKVQSSGGTHMHTEHCIPPHASSTGTPSLFASSSPARLYRPPFARRSSVNEVTWSFNKRTSAVSSSFSLRSSPPPPPSSEPPCSPSFSLNRAFSASSPAILPSRPSRVRSAASATRRSPSGAASQPAWSARARPQPVRRGVLAARLRCAAAAAAAADSADSAELGLGEFGLTPAAVHGGRDGSSAESKPMDGCCTHRTILLVL